MGIDYCVKSLTNPNGLLWDEERKAEADPLRKDATKLLKHFDFYVAHGAQIHVV